MSSVADKLSLVILAGGMGSRLGGVDKSQIRIDDIPQLQRWTSSFAGKVAEIIVSNRDGAEIEPFKSVADDATWPSASGPIAGLAAAARAVSTPWLMTLPVDTVELPQDLLARLEPCMESDVDIVRVVDGDGPQHLIALWRVAPLRKRLTEASIRNERAIWKLQLQDCAELAYPRFRCGNLNTVQDLEEFNARIPHESH